MKKLIVGALAVVVLPLVSFTFFPAAASPLILENVSVTEDPANTASFLKRVNVLSPKPNQILQNMPRNIGIGWEKVADATDYDVELGCKSCNGGAEWSKKTVKKIHYYTHWITPAVMSDDMYRVRVRGIASNGMVGPWSDYRYFTYDTRPVVYVQARKKNFALIPPQVLMPRSNEEFASSATISLSWQPLAEALKYQVEVECRLCDTSTDWKKNTYETLDTALEAKSLPAGHDYRFRVRAVDVRGVYGVWSQYRNFDVR